MATGNREWKDLYEFDTPVVHIDRATELEGKRVLEGTTAQAKKLMHRFTEAQMQAAMDKVEHSKANYGNIYGGVEEGHCCSMVGLFFDTEDKAHRLASIIMTMQAANRLQKTLKSGKTAFREWQVAHMMGCTIAVAAIAACGLSPIVRVPEGQHWMIKRALDAGAHGIMVPLVRTVAEARSIASYSKFPPSGTRGLGSPFSMEKFHPELTQ
ncbi:hypothetical protein B0A55_13093, partial [Friedmanniomyces simplex]